eukprot:TRINITY_DN4493_c0_g1_i1.p1 TRINITY_DN4493_c0_g1~~TRINITY_DN4493_c0_g1_i1.p1  ORF type:complete len:508 (-),score=104.28 TRINITY_DN4493_c0_g1_i1:1005-2528(-)
MQKAVRLFARSWRFASLSKGTFRTYLKPILVEELNLGNSFRSFFVRSNLKQDLTTNDSVQQRIETVSSDDDAPSLLSVTLPPGTPPGSSVTVILPNATAATQMKNSDMNMSALEIKDPAIIFNQVWSKLEAKYGKENLRFPKEIIWLMGAPGSGKSFNAPWILRARGITAKELIMSSLLTSPDAEVIKKEAGLVGDSLVVELLLERLLQPAFSNGVLVDGFPRTKVQVECIKLLRNKMIQLRNEFKDTELEPYFRRPVFRVAVLFVDEVGSVERQLKRGREAREHNQKIKETGVGELKEERDTDFSDELARRRYAVFKNHYSTLQELQKVFPFSVINTKASVAEVRENIMNEFMYQSSLELTEECFDIIQKIPVVSDITAHSRQNLVKRLDHYSMNHQALFGEVINSISHDFLPAIEMHAFSGFVKIKMTKGLFNDSMAVQMVLDVLSERGFHVSYSQLEERIPHRIDIRTGIISLSHTIIHEFDVTFSKAFIRQESSESLPTRMSM